MVEQGAARGRESRFRAPTNSGAPHLGGVGGDRHRVGRVVAPAEAASVDFTVGRAV